jgi:hypothetical protein
MNRVFQIDGALMNRVFQIDGALFDKVANGMLMDSHLEGGWRGGGSFAG